MQHFIAKCIVSLSVAAVMVFVLALSVNAQSSDITSDKLELIKSRCSSSQLALGQIEKRDAVSRINRGRAYDQMLRQVSAFNSRFAYNKISSPDLLQVTSDIQGEVDSFRANFDRYDTDLSDALKVDCKQKPEDYYNLIIKARDDRNAVGANVNQIAELMGKYREAVVKYQEGL